MPWVLGAPDQLTWSAARDKVRGDLWRPGTAGVPDDVVNRALHASILEIEAERRWLWLETILSTVDLDTAASSFDLLSTIGVIHSLAVLAGAGQAPERLVRAQLQDIRFESANSPGIPAAYAISDRTVHLDSIAPAGTTFEIIFDAQTPPRLEDAVDSPSVTMILHQQAVLAGAKADVALEYLHDDEKAERNRKAFDLHLGRMIDRDDQQRAELGGGSIVPDQGLFIAAHGRS